MSTVPHGRVGRNAPECLDVFHLQVGTPLELALTRPIGYSTRLYGHRPTGKVLVQTTNTHAKCCRKCDRRTKHWCA
jgi:hypothetical protein